MNSTSSVSIELLVLQRPHQACAAYREAIASLGLNARLHLCRNTDIAESYMIEHNISGVILAPEETGEAAFDFIYNAATYRPETRFGLVADNEGIVSRLPGVTVVGVHHPDKEIERARDFLPLFSLENPESKGGIQGDLSTVSLMDLLQMQCHIQNDIALELRAMSGEGLIEIQNGAITYAEFQAERGLDALVAMLGLTSGDFSTQPLEVSHEANLQGSWESTLMNAALLLDERQMSE